ncbi:sulfatase-like hydrolase/transferase [bacterium]|nr:sulfatase-like hydrolase/transferase [bacterium]
MKSNGLKLTTMTRLLAGAISFAAIAQESPEKDPASTGSEKKPLSLETEMAIMRVMNLENRIRTLQTVPVKMTDDELAGHFSGTWICFTTMRLNGQLGRGIMEIRLEQDGDELVGEGGQLKHPFDPPATIRPIGTRSAAVSDFIGQFKKAPKGRHNMVVIERQRVDGPTWATFTAVMAGDGRTARGTLVNAGGNYGLMFMVRREFLSDFKHLLTEEGRQAEAKRRWIGIENLEVALGTEIMDAARIRWWRADRNKDGKLQYTEFPHPDWKRANRNNDDAVDWAEEVSDRVLRKLAEEGTFLAKHGNDAQKQWPSIYAWGVAHPGFEQIFHFVDWDRDGKITSAEYTAFENQLDAYNDPSFPTTNQKGQTREDLRSKKGSGKKSKGVTKTKPNADPHLLQMEAAFSEEKLAKSREMWAALDRNRDNVWQHDEFPHPDWKRANRDGDDGLSWKEELADQMFRSQSRTYPKAHGSASQKEWSSRQTWEKDRPDFTALFAFIDWDHDGKISAAEYEVFDVQIKSYIDGSYPKTNEQGESGMAVFKRLAAETPKKTAPKTDPSRKTSWDSQGEWNADKPTVKWIFPFIDKNSDGKIDAGEYLAIQEYKKKHRDWQAQARKELGLTALPKRSSDTERPSLLFLNIDDWNDWNEVLQGHPQAITPNIKRLAERGVVFSNAICSSPTCFPSRSAIFTGIHPARSGNIVNDNGIHSWRSYAGDAVTLPKHLSAQGWTSIGIGKNFHKGDRGEFDEYIGKKGGRLKQVPGSGINLNPSGNWGIADLPSTKMPDYMAVSHGIEKLTTAKEPLFLSLGIYRPHVPWVVPQEYFDLYPLEKVQLPERRADDLDDLPERFKLLAHLEAKFGPGYNDMLAKKGYDRQFVRAYLACVTFADEQVGRILDAWDASPHSKNGYIVLWSDHGYNLGEKEGWSKMKPWYDSARCNLIIAGPGIPKGAACKKAVSLQDLYPTLVDLLDIASPSQKIDGNSLVPLLKNPNSVWDKPVVMSSEADGIRYDVVLDNDYRMTRLITGETELYQLSDDPHEFNNLAMDPKYGPVIERLAKHLTFDHPEIPADGWLEAEETPRQTSSDYKLRGNCHYPKSLSAASAGRVIGADLKAGKGSYLEFVIEMKSAGTYTLGAMLSTGGAVSVLADDVVNDSDQADTGYPMKKIGTVEAGSGNLKEIFIGSVAFDEPGLKLIRFMSNVPKQQLLIDRIQIQKQ